MPFVYFPSASVPLFHFFLFLRFLYFSFAFFLFCFPVRLFCLFFLFMFLLLVLFFSLSFPLLLPPLSSHALPFSPPFCPFFALPSHLFVILSPLYTVGPWLSAYVVWVLSHKTPDPYSMHLMSLMAALNSTFLCLFENDGETKHRCNLCLCLLGEKTPPAKTWHDYSFCLCLLKKQQQSRAFAYNNPCRVSATVSANAAAHCCHLRLDSPRQNTIALFFLRTAVLHASIKSRFRKHSRNACEAL